MSGRVNDGVSEGDAMRVELRDKVRDHPAVGHLEGFRARKERSRMTIIAHADDDVSWWTWAGYRANATLAATLSDLADSTQRFDDARIRLRSDLTVQLWKASTADAAGRLCLPDVDDRALAGLKFSDALPNRLATATLAARGADLEGAAQVLAEPVRFWHGANR